MLRRRLHASSLRAPSPRVHSSNTFPLPTRQGAALSHVHASWPVSGASRHLAGRQGAQTPLNPAFWGRALFSPFLVYLSVSSLSPSSSPASGTGPGAASTQTRRGPTDTPPLRRRRRPCGRTDKPSHCKRRGAGPGAAPFLTDARTRTASSRAGGSEGRRRLCTVRSVWGAEMECEWGVGAARRGLDEKFLDSFFSARTG